jgi:FAD synthase
MVWSFNVKKLLANQFKNDYEYEQAKKRIKKGAIEARNKRLQRDYDVSGVVVSGESESVQESLYYSLNKEYCYE